MEVTCGTTVDPDAGAGVEVTGGGIVDPDAGAGVEVPATIIDGAVAAAGLGGDVGCHWREGMGDSGRGG